MLNNVSDHEDLDFDYSDITTNVQLVCLDILREIHRVCVENDIHYSLGAGTVIGFKLFGGYIPWDDDIDLLMVREDYEKFLRLFPEKCSSRYKLVYYRDCEEFNSLYAKVYDKNTTIVENPNGRYLKNGAFIDISVLDGVPNRIFHKRAILRGKFAYSLLYRQCGLEAGDRWKQFIMKFIANKFFFSIKEKIYRWYEDFCISHGNRPYVKYAELMVKNFWSSLYDVDLFNEYVIVKFEGVETYIIKDYDRFLIQKYNKKDFVRNQPREKRMPSHSIYFTDKIGYEEFDLKKFTNVLQK